MISELRDRLTADLKAVEGINIETGVPSRLTPPVIYVTAPPDSYVLSGQTFGEYVISLDVQIVIRNRDLAYMDTLIEGVLANTMDWALVGVDAPGIFSANNFEYFGTTIHLSKATRPEGA